MTEERYEIIKLLGKGRTGGVYEAEDTNLGRKVALRRFFAQSKKTELEEYKADFEKVAHSLSALQHPNLLRVYDAGVDSDGAYIISQLLKGETLQDKIKAGPIPVWEVNDLAQQMLDALSTAHKEGFVHGAITPGSILMSPRARGGFLYVILDMGLSRLAPLIQGKDSILSIMADPAILAPELFDGGVGTERADLYMLGQILYMCLAGGHPFGGVPAKEAELMHQEGLPSILEYAEGVPEDFRLWLEALIQVNPEDRPATAVEALNSLPKVARPARKHSAAVYTATAHLSRGTAVQLQTPAGNVTGPLSSYGMPPVAANTGPISGLESGIAPGVVPLGKQKGSKKGLFIGLGVAAAIGAIVTTVLLTRDGSQNSRSSANGADQSHDTDNSYANRHAEDAEKIVFTHFDAAKLGDADDWKYEAKGQQAATETKDGWSIDTANSKTLPGIKFPLKSNENDMFDLGWKLTYVIRPIKGEHRIGFNIDEKINPGWEGDDVNLYLAVEHTADGKVKLTAMDSGNNAKSGKSITVPYNGAKGWNTIVIEQKREAESGAYSVSIDGKSAFEDTFTQGKAFNGSWTNQLFSSAYSKQKEASWVIKELKLETL